MKIRLDQLLVEKSYAPSRSKAKQLIDEGVVFCDGKKATKAGQMVSDSAKIRLEKRIEFVSRGAEKLTAALEAFKIESTGAVVADVGASTGGFTDLLLQRGAKKVYAIDVGHDQLAEKLKNDDRVANMEGVNIRHDVELPEQVGFAVVDLSFISLKLCLEPIFKLIKENGFVVALVKPQFEAGPGVVNKNGVIKDPRKRDRVVKEFKHWCAENGYKIGGWIESPIVGKVGNVEYLAFIKSEGAIGQSRLQI